MENSTRISMIFFLFFASIGPRVTPDLPTALLFHFDCYTSHGIFTQKGEVFSVIYQSKAIQRQNQSKTKANN